MSSTDQETLIEYLDDNGSIYLEGANVATDHHTTEFFGYFGANLLSSGTNNEIQNLNGEESSITENLNFTYSGGTDAHYQIDRLESGEGNILFTSEDDYVRTILNQNRTYRTIVSSPILGAFKDGNQLNLKAYLMGEYINFLTATESDNEPQIITPSFQLIGNYPNPFNPETTISFEINEERNTTLNIYNLKGQKVKTLINRELKAGSHSIGWNGTDTNGNSVASGVYLYKLQSGKYTSTKKMILMK